MASTKNCLYVLLLVFLFSCGKEGVDEPTIHSFEGSIGSNDNSTVRSMDDGLVICGNASDHILLLKITKNGQTVWDREFSAGNMSTAAAITKAGNDDFFICGSTYRNYPSRHQDILLIKTDANGDTIWTKTFGGNDFDYGRSIITTRDGNILLAGTTRRPGGDPFGDICLLKLNTNGDIIWDRYYPDGGGETPIHLLEGANGEILITGTNEDNGQPTDLYLMKLDAGGSLLWDKRAKLEKRQTGYSSIELTDGRLVIAGQSMKDGKLQVLLVKAEGDGSIIWSREFGHPDLSEQALALKPNEDGSFIITGSSYDVRTMDTDVMLLKVDAEGKEIFLNTFGTHANDAGINLLKDGNGDNMITGIYKGSIFMTRVGKDGYFK